MTAPTDIEAKLQATLDQIKPLDAALKALQETATAIHQAQMVLQNLRRAVLRGNPTPSGVDFRVLDTTPRQGWNEKLRSER